MNDPVADPFLYERIYDYLLDEIRNDTLKAGDRVPSEKELAERFGVSRITSKRALALLAEAGVLDRRRGKGSFVTKRASELEPPHSRERRRRSQSRRSSCIALVLPAASEAYGLELLWAIEERCDELGYHLVVKRTRDRQDVEERAIETLVGNEVADGLIVFPVHGEFYNASLVKLVFNRSPLVVVDRHLQGIPACAVYTDNVAAARALTHRLLEHGHNEVAFVSPPVENTSSIEERLRGYQLALHDRDITAAPPCFTELRSTLPGSSTEANRQADHEAIRDFLTRQAGVTGFVACEYNIAVLLRDVLEDTHPADTPARRVACFDSPPRSRSAAAFVHIKQNQRAMGRQAVDLLIAQLDGQEVPLQTIIPFSLVDPFTAEP
ncbi:GntR family transcriptional regulator [Actinopolymorpha alba]|uniref:GntR family transcriptional regulator n=1 Tax=Actinopolymorpha alba TaxID=533267 RepID=UPI00037A4D2C|nr:GntR family transcriptional regulator [Actinopolymorpha alba]